jgi:hypothetical protein
MTEDPKLNNPTPSDRLEVRRLSSAILEAVRADESVARAANMPSEYAENLRPRTLVYLAISVDDILTQLAQEVEALTAERDNAQRDLDGLSRVVTAQLHYDMKSLLTGTPEERARTELAAVKAALVEACDIGQRLATVRTTPFGEDYQRDHAQRLQDIRAAVAGTEGK